MELETIGEWLGVLLAWLLICAWAILAVVFLINGLWGYLIGGLIIMPLLLTHIIASYWDFD